MNTAIHETDNPFDASYEEYLRAHPTTPPAWPTHEDLSALEADDPEVTQAAASTTDFTAPAVGDGVEAHWSHFADTAQAADLGAPNQHTPTTPGPF